MVSSDDSPAAGPGKSPLTNAGVVPSATRRYLSSDLIARRRVLAQAEGVQDLMKDLEFGPAALLLEVSCIGAPAAILAERRAPIRR